MVTRRAFLATLTSGLLAASLGTGAQPGGKVPRVGYLVITGTGVSMREGLRALGYVEGKTIIIELRSAEGRTDRFLPWPRSWSNSTSMYS